MSSNYNSMTYCPCSKAVKQAIFWSCGLVYCCIYLFPWYRWLRSRLCSISRMSPMKILQSCINQWYVKPHVICFAGSSDIFLRSTWVSIALVNLAILVCCDAARTKVLTHWGRDKMDAISQTTCSSTFSWMKIYEFRLKFHWSLFLRVQLIIFQHRFR